MDDIVMHGRRIKKVWRSSGRVRGESLRQWVRRMLAREEGYLFAPDLRAWLERKD